MKNANQRAEDKGADARANQWHLDRRVPMAIIVVLLSFGVSSIWYVAQTDGRVIAVEKWIEDNKLIQSRLDRLEVQGEFIQQTLSRIEDKLDQSD